MIVPPTPHTPCPHTTLSRVHATPYHTQTSHERHQAATHTPLVPPHTDAYMYLRAAPQLSPRTRSARTPNPSHATLLANTRVQGRRCLGARGARAGERGGGGGGGTSPTDEQQRAWRESPTSKTVGSRGAVLQRLYASCANIDKQVAPVPLHTQQYHLPWLQPSDCVLTRPRVARRAQTPCSSHRRPSLRYTLTAPPSRVPPPQADPLPSSRARRLLPSTSPPPCTPPAPFPLPP